MYDLFEKHLKQLIDISDSEYEEVLHYFKPVHFQKKDFILREGDMVQHTYFVMEGLAKSVYVDDTGKEHILQFACEDWWISDFTAFFKREKATLFVECLQDTFLLSISYEHFEELGRSLPKMEHFYRVKGNFGYVALQQRILSLMTQSAKVRYQKFCSQYPHLVKRIPKQQIANYLGITRETLSRIQKQ